jgi:hypothetical protein
MPPRRHRDIETSRHFKYQSKPPAKGLIATCKLCGGHGLAKSTYCERKHLDNECPKYQQWKDENDEKQQTTIP